MNTNYIREVSVKYIGARRKGCKIKQPGDVYPILNKLLRDEEKEHFIAIFLNGAHEVKSYSIVSIGTLNSCQVHPREVYRPAILLGSASIIVAHNHPSGQLIASPEDLVCTRKLVEASKIIGINLLDHIIFSKDGYISLQDKGVM